MVSGPVSVDSNATFTTMNNTTISGPVTATDPSEVALNGGSIYGPLYIDGGIANSLVASSHEACGVTISGPVTLTDFQTGTTAGSYSAFLLGNNDNPDGEDPIVPCAGNTIDGPLSITNNTGLIEAGDNVINGPVTVTGNSGTNDSNVVHLRGNTIKGPLQCSGNNPAPTNDGMPNTANSRSGQCSSPTF